RWLRRVLGSLVQDRRDAPRRVELPLSRLGLADHDRGRADLVLPAPEQRVVGVPGRLRLALVVETLRDHDRGDVLAVEEAGARGLAPPLARVANVRTGDDVAALRPEVDHLGSEVAPLLLVHELGVFAQEQDLLVLLVARLLGPRLAASVREL